MRARRNIHQLGSKYERKNIGLYRDDGLAAIKASRTETDRLRKDITKMFEDLGLKITVETQLTKTDFLDVQLDLQQEKYKPFKNSKWIPLGPHPGHGVNL